MSKRDNQNDIKLELVDIFADKIIRFIETDTIDKVNCYLSEVERYFDIHLPGKIWRIYKQQELDIETLSLAILDELKLAQQELPEKEFEQDDRVYVLKPTKHWFTIEPERVESVGIVANKGQFIMYRYWITGNDQPLIPYVDFYPTKKEAIKDGLVLAFESWMRYSLNNFPLCHRVGSLLFCLKDGQ